MPDTSPETPTFDWLSSIFTSAKRWIRNGEWGKLFLLLKFVAFAYVVKTFMLIFYASYIADAFELLYPIMNRPLSSYFGLAWIDWFDSLAALNLSFVSAIGFFLMVLWAIDFFLRVYVLGDKSPTAWAGAQYSRRAEIVLGAMAALVIICDWYLFAVALSDSEWGKPKITRWTLIGTTVYVTFAVFITWMAILTKLKLEKARSE